MQTRTGTVAALLFSLLAIACGEERASWSGFPLFPPDGGPQLAPELESSLRAAEVAFVTQLAAEQAAKAGGATAAPEPSQNSADAGAKPPPRMAADVDPRAGNGEKSNEPRTRNGAPDAGAPMVERAVAGSHSEPAMRPSDPPPSVPMEPGDQGNAGAGSMGPVVPPSQPSEPDAGVTALAGSGAGTTGGAGAGAMMAAGTGGMAGMIANEDPSQTSQPDAAIPDQDAADGGV